MMNQLINIEITNTKTDIQKLLDVFQKYGVTTTHPIDYEKFVKDVINTTASTEVFVYDPSSSNYTFNL